MRLIRVFPRTTKATPQDDLARFGPPDLFDEADEVHVSVTFTSDKAIAERLAEQWKYIAPTKVGGVAYGDASVESTETMRAAGIYWRGADDLNGDQAEGIWSAMLSVSPGWRVMTKDGTWTLG